MSWKTKLNAKRMSVRERQKRKEKLQRKLLRPVHREQDHCSPQHPRNLTQNILEAVEERWRVTYRTVHNLRSKIQEEDMRSTPGYPSESDLDRGCVFWTSATQRNCKRQWSKQLPLSKGNLPQKPQWGVVNCITGWNKQCQDTRGDWTSQSCRNESREDSRADMSCSEESTTCLELRLERKHCHCGKQWWDLMWMDWSNLDAHQQGVSKTHWTHVCSLRRSLHACEISVQHSQISRWWR